MEIFDYNLKDGIDAFDVDKLTPLLIVIDPCISIMHNYAILQAQSLVVIWEFSVDLSIR